VQINNSSEGTQRQNVKRNGKQHGLQLGKSVQTAFSLGKTRDGAAFLTEPQAGPQKPGSDKTL
jgi:hypothetical protein